MFYLPHVIFLFYKIGQSLFSPATKLFLYDSVCQLYEEEYLLALNQSLIKTSSANFENIITIANSSRTLPLKFAPNHVNTTGEGAVNDILPVDCQHLSGDLEKEVQKSAADYIMAMKIVQDIPAFFLGIYCGGWMDKVGRRPPMMIPCLGGTIASILFTIVQVSACLLCRLHPEYHLRSVT